MKFVFPMIYTLISKIRSKWNYILRSINNKRLIREFGLFGHGSSLRTINSLTGMKYIRVGENVQFCEEITMNAWESFDCIDETSNHPIIQHFTPEIVIGDNSIVGAWNHITAINKIVIGDGFLSGKWVTITDNSHGKTETPYMNILPTKRRLCSKGPVLIGKNVWVGDKCTILPGVTIGDGAVIGANSVVSTDIPPYSVVAGVPAKVVKYIKPCDNEK